MKITKILKETAHIIATTDYNTAQFYYNENLRKYLPSLKKLIKHEFIEVTSNDKIIVTQKFYNTKF